VRVPALLAAVHRRFCCWLLLLRREDEDGMGLQMEPGWSAACFGDRVLGGLYL
jgi:hypothetical protein